jgi:4-amino-4-deoxychorismate lyase
VPCDTISVNDRGLLYGDGVFRTLLLRDGRLQQWHRHFAKLHKDCSTINLPCPPESLLSNELASLVQDRNDGVVKIIVTRGKSLRGYAPSPQPNTTRILSLNPLPVYPEEFANSGVRLHLCQLRLAHQPIFAGVKHLNRLENVIAAAEWDNADIAEGLLFDESGYVIEGVRSNIFMVKDGNLITPNLTRCGVSGVQRDRIIDWAERHGKSCKILDVTLDELLSSEELFLVNSVIGLWPVREMPGFRREHYPVAKSIQNWIHHEID